MKKFFNLSKILSFFFCFTLINSNAQLVIPTDEEIANGTDEQKLEAAEYLFAQHLYYHSLRVWKNLLKDYPDNPKINYKAGYCQLKVGSEKAKALAYLLKTIGHISSKKNEAKIKEDQVTVDAYLLLGEAYHLNGKFNEALKAFEDFKKEGKDVLSTEDIIEADKYISWTKNAIEMTANPIKDIFITNLGSQINTEDEEYSPVLSLDENILYFTSRRLREDGSNKGVYMVETGSLFEDVYLSFREEDGKTWSKPKMMNFGNNADDNEATVSVSADGTEVYIYWDKEGGGDIYKSSFLEGGFNAELEHMQGDINSSAWETHCSLTPDGKTLFFTSNRSGGIGGLDIYRMRKLPNGEWSKAEILPPPINTKYDEDAPFIHPSGNLLYFSSNAPTSMGGCDVFYSRLVDKENLKFDDPVNMGFPINTTDDDVFFVMDASGKNGYYSSAQNGGYGSHDIFMIEFMKPVEEPFAILKGHIFMTDGSQIPDNIMVNITDITKNNEMLQFKPRKIDGGFVMSLVPCNKYSIEYLKGDELLRKDEFVVPCKSSYQEIYKELYIDTLFLAVDPSILKNNNNPVNNVNTNTNSNINSVKKEPLYYDKYFDYNLLDVAVSEKLFADFIAGIKERAAIGKVEIKIESSASKVPTTTFKTNSNLAKSRCEEAKTELMNALEKEGVNTTNIVIQNTKSLVQGPNYKNDYEQNKANYGKYQYTKIWAQ